MLNVKKLLIVSLFFGFVLFISGCEEGIQMAPTKYHLMETPNDPDVFWSEGGGGIHGASRDPCQDLIDGECVETIAEGNYELICNNYPSGLCSGSLLCEARESQCDNANPFFQCGCPDLNSICGNGVVEINEECELPNTMNNFNCSQITWECDGVKIGRRDPYADCNAQCQCNNEGFFNYECNIETCGAQCEQGNLSGHNCTTEGFDNGTLTCDLSGCTFDTSGCYNDEDLVCGDNIIQTPNTAGLNETCDGSDLGNVTCGLLGFDSGTLSCLTDCTGFDTSGCITNPEICTNNLDDDGDGDIDCADSDCISDPACVGEPLCEQGDVVHFEYQAQNFHLEVGDILNKGTTNIEVTFVFNTEIDSGGWYYGEFLAEVVSSEFIVPSETFEWDNVAFYNNYIEEDGCDVYESILLERYNYMTVRDDDDGECNNDDNSYKTLFGNSANVVNSGCSWIYSDVSNGCRVYATEDDGGIYGGDDCAQGIVDYGYSFDGYFFQSGDNSGWIEPNEYSKITPFISASGSNDAQCVMKNHIHTVRYSYVDEEVATSKLCAKDIKGKGKWFVCDENTINNIVNFYGVNEPKKCIKKYEGCIQSWGYIIDPIHGNRWGFTNCDGIDHVTRYVWVNEDYVIDPYEPSCDGSDSSHVCMTDSLNPSERYFSTGVEACNEVLNMGCSNLDYSCHNIVGGAPEWITSENDDCEDTSFASSCAYRADCTV